MLTTQKQEFQKTMIKKTWQQLLLSMMKSYQNNNHKFSNNFLLKILILPFKILM